MEKSLTFMIEGALVELTLGFSGQSYMVEHQTLGDIGTLAIFDGSVHTFPGNREWNTIEEAVGYLVERGGIRSPKEVKIMQRVVENNKGQVLRYVPGSKTTNDKDVVTIEYTFIDGKGVAKTGTMKLDAWNELPRHEESEEEKAARKKARRQERRKARRAAANEAAELQDAEEAEEAAMLEAETQVLGPDEEDDEEDDDEE